LQSLDARTTQKLGLTTLVSAGESVAAMSVKTRNISLPPELDALIGDRVRSGLYGDASEVVRAGLRALAREEMGVSLRRFEEIMGSLPDGPPLVPEIEQDVERRIRAARATARRRARK
jgi:antitoxin ParD1/3/4